MSNGAESSYPTLRKLGALGREIERRRGPDPYPHPTGPPPSLQELRRRRDEITQTAARYGARSVRVVGSVARADAGPNSDLDLVVDLDPTRGLLAQAALQNALEDLLGCPVDVLTTSNLRHAQATTRDRIKREAILL